MKHQNTQTSVGYPGLSRLILCKPNFDVIWMYAAYVYEHRIFHQTDVTRLHTICLPFLTIFDHLVIMLVHLFILACVYLFHYFVKRDVIS